MLRFARRTAKRGGRSAGTFSGSLLDWGIQGSFQELCRVRRTFSGHVTLDEFGFGDDPFPLQFVAHDGKFTYS